MEWYPNQNVLSSSKNYLTTISLKTSQLSSKRSWDLNRIGMPLVVQREWCLLLSLKCLRHKSLAQEKQWHRSLAQGLPLLIRFHRLMLLITFRKCLMSTMRSLSNSKSNKEISSCSISLKRCTLLTLNSLGSLMLRKGISGTPISKIKLKRTIATSWFRLRLSPVRDKSTSKQIYSKLFALFWNWKLLSEDQYHTSIKIFWTLTWSKLLKRNICQTRNSWPKSQWSRIWWTESLLL